MIFAYGKYRELYDILHHFASQSKGTDFKKISDGSAIPISAQTRLNGFTNFLRQNRIWKHFLSKNHCWRAEENHPIGLWEHSIRNSLLEYQSNQSLSINNVSAQFVLKQRILEFLFQRVDSLLHWTGERIHIVDHRAVRKNKRLWVLILLISCAPLSKWN